MATNDETRLVRVEERLDRVEERQQRIETEQAETRVYVRQIFERLDEIKADFITFFTQQTESTTKGTTQWIEFAKWIIGGTIFVIVAYLFTGGGVG